MEGVYILQHVYQLGDDCDAVKLVGVYSSRESAEQAIKRLREKPGFRVFPKILDPGDVYGEGFDIEEYQVDRDNWTEGFATEKYVTEE